MPVLPRDAYHVPTSELDADTPVHSARSLAKRIG